MRVLFSTTPGRGHVHPMVPLAHAFHERGDEVLWAAPADAAARLVAAGFAAEPAGLTQDASHRGFQQRFPEAATLTPQALPPFMFPRLFGAVRAAPMLEDLLPIVKHWQPSFVVRDAGDFAAPIAAAAIGVPCATHAFGALLPAERVTEAGDVVAPLWEAHGLEPRPYGGSYDWLYLDIYPPSLQVGDAAHVAEMVGLRPIAFATPGDEPVPPLVTERSDRPLVYLTFGTVFNANVALFARVVEALRSLPIRLLVTVGPGGDPSSLGPQPPHVYVARYVPQTSVLPACAAVVSHAGSGTFLASLAEGLPQVCLPQAADQFLNAAACERTGAGITLLPDSATASAVHDAAAAALGDPGLRTTAERIAAEIATMPAPAAVAEELATRWG